MALQIHNGEGGAGRYRPLVAEIAALGADTILISVNGFQRNVSSVLIEYAPPQTLADDELEELIRYAHGSRLRVVLMPKVLLSDPQGNDWRGRIRPTSWTGWFEQYGRFILHYAALAERAGVEIVMVGSELISTERYTEEWLELIRRTRATYSGLLGYSANWDHYTNIQFWSALDLMGLTTYYKLAEEPGPEMDTLRDAWRRIRRDIRAFQTQVNKPLLFTEVGWCSQEGCSVEAWNYYRQDEATEAGLEEQRRNYAAFLDTWGAEADVGGIIWWEWTEGVGGPRDHGYTPKGKPAEKLLRDYFRSSHGPGTPDRTGSGGPQDPSRPAAQTRSGGASSRPRGPGSDNSPR